MNLNKNNGQKYCSIQIDMDDNQWVLPRQQNLAYDVSNSINFLKALSNIEKFLVQFPITIFLVGEDMTVKAKLEAIKAFLNRKQEVEIANHSFSHNNRLLDLSKDDKRKEVECADNIIKEKLGLDRLFGFRSPGYVFDGDLIDIVKDLGYEYDASLFPSYFGPILRNLNLLLNGVRGRGNFGHLINGLMPNEPYLLDRQSGLIELNVSVCPFFRLPIHYSIVRHRYGYSALSGLINRVQNLNFVFHLYDFLNIDSLKLNSVLQLITKNRKLILAKDTKKFLPV